jgi:dTDP-4-dehydrorhamnose 3,5-epimerase
MNHTPCSIPDVVLFTPRRHHDPRGFFAETFRQDLFQSAAGSTVFVQENHSLSRAVGTIRGLHFQVPPRAQGKLIQVIRGAIVDVAVDIRVGSLTFGQHVRVVLSAENGQQLWVPIGFAHGLCTTEPDTEVAYKVTDYYSPTHDRGLAFDDPALAIDWGVDPRRTILSAKDRQHPRLAELPQSFLWTGEHRSCSGAC